MIEYILAAGIGIALIWLIRPNAAPPELPEKDDEHAPRDVHG